MQTELTQTHPGLIQLFGVNMPGQESGVPLMIDGHVLGLLQDTASINVSDAWGVTWRDLYVLDEENKLVEVFNLTGNDLADATNYDYLKDLLIRVATD